MRTKPRSLPGHNAQCVYCTERAITFLDSPYPQLPFGMNIPLVRMRYHCCRQLRSFPHFHSRPNTMRTKPRFLGGHNAQCVYCTDSTIKFLDSPSTQLPFVMNITLVRRCYHCFRQLRIFPNFHSRPNRMRTKPRFWRTIKPSAFIAPSGRLHFWILHTHSYLLV